MSGWLATFVHVVDDEGETHILGPEDDVPGWAAKRITNPKAWAGSPSLESAAGGGDGRKQGTSPSGSGAAPGGPPPKAGAGSGLEAWLAYAKDQGFDIDGEPKRDELIAALEAAGVPTE